MSDFKLVLRNLFSSRSRFALTLGGIAVGITALVVMITLGSGLRAEIENQATDLGANLVVTPKGWCAYEQVKVLSGNQLPDAIPAEEVAAIEAIPGLKVLPYLTVGSAINNEPVAVTGIKMAQTLETKGWAIAEGQAPGDSDYGVLAGAAIADNFELGVGDEVAIRGTSFVVSGVLESTGGGDDAVLYLPIEVAKSVYETDDRVSFLAVGVDDLSKVDLYAKQITDTANVAVISDEQLLQSVLSVVDTVGTTLRIIATVAVLTAAFGIVNTMQMAALERRREIGILKSLGSPNSRIFRIFVAESAAYGVLGGVLGLAIGIVASQIITPMIAQNEFTAFVGNASVNALPSLIEMAQILVGSVAISALAGLYPAWRAARLSPVEAISYE